MYVLRVEWSIVLIAMHLTLITVNVQLTKTTTIQPLKGYLSLP